MSLDVTRQYPGKEQVQRALQPVRLLARPQEGGPAALLCLHRGHQLQEVLGGQL